MSRHFHYRTIGELRSAIASLGLDITLEEELSAVARPVRIGKRTIGNALGIHPMEGCDGTPDGRPGELTARRWERFGAGGAKLIWGEATAVVPEGRANPRQLVIDRNTADDLARLVEGTHRVHREAFGRDDDLLVGLQLTHSGRYSHPRPLIAAHNPSVDARTRVPGESGRFIDDGYPLVTDAYLGRLEEAFVTAARLAAEAGFDFVDIKQCHTYLLNELLGARNRPGPYGGSFENRTRFIRNVLRAIRGEVGERILLASRINVYDGIPFRTDPATGEGIPENVGVPYSHGFGIDSAFPLREDLEEPLRLVGLMREEGVALVNVSMGSPYLNPHIGRPYERPAEGHYESPEHPLVGVDRHFRLAATVQKAYPELAVVGTGYSWLQRFFINAAESNLRRERISIAAVGRGALAYPDFARDALERGALKQRKVCLSVSFCTDLMRAKENDLGQFPTGCVPRDDLYARIYREARGARRPDRTNSGKEEQT